MDTHFDDRSHKDASARGPLVRPLSERALTGIALILIGVALLLATVFPSVFTGYIVLIAVGLIFIAWSIAAQRAGLMVPGGIIAGIGAGVSLMSKAFPNAGGAADLGIMLLCLGAGFTSITVLTRLFVPPAQTWALVPGIGCLAVGLLIVIGAVTPSMLNALWPLIIIGIGLYLLWRATRRGPSGPPQAT